MWLEGRAAEPRLARTAGATQPPPALGAALDKSMTQRDGGELIVPGDTGDLVFFCRRPPILHVTAATCLWNNSFLRPRRR